MAGLLRTDSYSAVFNHRRTNSLMKLLDETMFGNPVIGSDSGLTVIVKLEDGTIGAEGFSINLSPGFHDEDIDMRNRPEEIWEEFFRQSTLDEV